MPFESAELIQGIADEVYQWRMEEYIAISFYTFYTYFVITTLDEEASVILPQKWSRGKWMYMIIRYGVLFCFGVNLICDYRNYFSITPLGCKAMGIISEIAHQAVSLACDLSLGLCLGALLQAKTLYLAIMITLCIGIAFFNSVIGVVSSFQIRASAITSLDKELGYPCYNATLEEKTAQTITFFGAGIVEYVNLASTIVLAVLGPVAVVLRYKGRSGPLIRVIRRDGGMHYLFLLASRLIIAIIYTPALIPSDTLYSSSVFYAGFYAHAFIVPIIAQRLLINMRKVDYMGSEPLASKLLFAPPAPESEGDAEEELGSFELAARYQGGEGSTAPVDEGKDSVTQPCGQVPRYRDARP